MDGQTSPRRGSRKPVSTNEVDFFEKSAQTTHTIGHAGNYLFDSVEERERRFAEERLESGAVNNFASSKAYTPLDGIAKGVVALGTGVGSGFTGLFTEPFRGASENGTSGFFSGIGKGLIGLVAKPVAGVVELGIKTGEGFANTPSTISNLVTGNNRVTYFGSPLATSLELAKSLNQRHLIIKCLDELEHCGLDKRGVFETPPHENLVMEFRTQFNDLIDVNMEAIEPNVVLGVLKLFLIELPNPLIPYLYYDDLFKVGLTATSNTPSSSLSTSSPAKPTDDENVKKIKAMLSQIPEENKAVLNELCIVFRKFLKSVSRNGLDLLTLASSVNLCILRPSSFDINLDQKSGGVVSAISSFSSSTQLSVAEKKAINYVVKAIIMNYQPGYLQFNLYGEGV